jgi:hypothetical protein
MKNAPYFLLVFVLIGINALAQDADSTRKAFIAAQAVIQQKSAEDHQQMMQQLGITLLRPGPSGNPKAPNAANVDESKATPYPNLPDPLLLKNGRKVTTAKMWWNQRRAEIVEDFDREIYGRVPRNVPKVTWKVVREIKEMNGEFPVITKSLVGHVDNSSYPAINVAIELTLSTPANATALYP